MRKQHRRSEKGKATETKIWIQKCSHILPSHGVISMNSVYRKYVVTTWSVISRQTAMNRAQNEKLNWRIWGILDGEEQTRLKYFIALLVRFPAHTKGWLLSHWAALSCMENFPARFPQEESSFLKLYSNVAHGSLLCRADQHCHSFLVNSKWENPQTELFCSCSIEEPWDIVCEVR